MADNQFESLRGDIADLGANINVVSRDKHVPEIERYIHTIKERVRATHNMTPFKFIPPHIHCGDGIRQRILVQYVSYQRRYIQHKSSG